MVVGRRSVLLMSTSRPKVQKKKRKSRENVAMCKPVHKTNIFTVYFTVYIGHFISNIVYSKTVADIADSFYSASVSQRAVLAMIMPSLLEDR